MSLQLIGLSNSEIPGSKVICTYTGLIAAYHVLHRLREPRHPPVALHCFYSCYELYFQLALLYLLTSVKLFYFKIENLNVKNLYSVQHGNDQSVIKT